MKSKQIMREILLFRDGIIIDAHTHSSGISVVNFLRGIFPMTFSVRELVGVLKENGVDYAISTPMPNPVSCDIGGMEPVASGVFHQKQMFAYERTNLNFLSECEYFGENRVFPFILVDLHNDLKTQQCFLRRNIDLIYGIKIHTTCLRQSILEMDESFSELLQELDLPVLVHTKVNSGYGDAQQVIKFAQKYPQIRLCAAHLAGFSKSALNEVTFLPNLFIDTSPFLGLCRFALSGNQKIIANDRLCLDYSNPKRVLEFLLSNTNLSDHLLWGTDVPWNGDDNQKSIDYHEEVNLLLRLSTETIRRISQANVCRYLFG